LAAANEREEADAKAYALSAVMKALAQTDPKIIQSLTSVNMEPRQLVALAFKELAESTDKIGQLNISPELLRELLARRTRSNGALNRKQDSTYNSSYKFG